jgi:hypothetical protein
MSLSISKLQLTIDEIGVLSPGFRNLIENHRLLLKKDTNTFFIELSPHDEYKYTGDFYQLLSKLKINQSLFWITMRINDMHSPIDYNGDKKIILVPAMATINYLLTRFLNETTIS